MIGKSLRGLVSFMGIFLIHILNSQHLEIVYKFYPLILQMLVIVLGLIYCGDPEDILIN